MPKQASDAGAKLSAETDGPSMLGIESSLLPPGWAAPSLFEITTKIGSGATPRGGETAYKSSGTPLIRSMNVRFEGLARQGMAFIDQAQAMALNGATVARGDVLLNITGASIGRVCLLPDDLAGARVNQHVAIVRLREAAISGFISRYIASPVVQSFIFQNESGATRQALTKKQIEGFVIPLPPLAEQKRIMARLETLENQLRTARAALAEVPTLLTQARQSLLSAALSGELTKEWRKANLTKKSDVLGNLERQRRQAWKLDELAKLRAAGRNPRNTEWKASYKSPAKLSTTPDITLPDGWTWVSLDSTLASLRNGIAVKPEGKTGLAILRISAVRPLRLDLNDRRFLAPDGFDYSAYALNEGDLLFTRYNGNPELVGVCAVVPQPEDLVVYPDKLIRGCVVKGCIAPGFVAAAVNCGASRRFISECGKTAAGQVGISGSDLKRTPIPLPTLEEQKEIVHRLDAAFARLDAVAAAHAEAVAELDRLEQSLLAKAFRGELVPQDPNDEPAAQMLERLRSQPPEAAPPKAIKAGRRLRADAVQVARMAAPARPVTATPAPARLPSPIAPPPAALRPPTPEGSAPNIDELDKNELMARIREVLHEHGPCDRETAIKQTAYSLGYQRAGRVIAEEINNAIRTAMRRYVLVKVNGEIRANGASLSDMEAEDREFMKKQFLAAISEGGRVWMGRDEAAVRLARWFGFRNTGPRIKETAKSLINGLLRDGRLESEDGCVRRIS